jgi:anti-sigma regulatory factor (Ser/Thr protein kinase)
LRYIDVVPAVLGFMTQVDALKPHQGTLFLIISELFNNALDHGLLGLDSGTKNLIGGFEIYMQHRAERLAELAAGRIELSFLMHEDEGRAVLDIDVTDSGPGFDHEALLRDTDLAANDTRPHGRGLALVRGLCSDLVFSGVGNRVWTRFLL